MYSTPAAAADPDMSRPIQTSLQPIRGRRTIIIATQTLNNGVVFSNGLYQNIFTLYRLMEALGYLPFFLVNTKDQEPAGYLIGCRVLTLEEFAKKPIPVHLYLEAGMSLSPENRKILKMLGARSAKLYLGNILNIDTETSMFYPQMNFAHHVVGETDEIWVSPHYEQHREYAAVLNGCSVSKSRIAPYVWDSTFIAAQGTPKWIPAASSAPPTFVIMEPNISFQKNAFLPLWILEAWHRKTGRDLRLVFINGNRFKAMPHSQENILPALDIYNKGFIEFRDRNDMISIMRENPSATFLCHQINNEYNYMILELLWAGFPVVHNGDRWADFGYTFRGCEIGGGVAAIERALTEHGTGGAQVQRSRAETLFWRHSIHNPSVQAGWKELVEKPAA
jgi:hypothetical protein